MKVEVFVTGIISTNCYLAINEETKEAVIIDPAGMTKKMIEYIKDGGITLKAILLTHAHFDHIMGIDKTIEEFGEMPVYVEETDVPLLTDEKLNESIHYTNGYTYEGGTVIHDGDIIKEAGMKFQVIHTPGHTAGGVSYYVEADHVLFSGDTLFRCSVGRFDFETSSKEALIRSIKDKLFLLPDDTRVLPGHSHPTTIAYEKEHNPFVS